MKKIALLSMMILLFNYVYANEVVCKDRCYGCLIDDAQNKIFDGHREEGVNVLSAITGLSVDSRKVLAVTLLSKKEGGDVQKIKTAQLLLESAFREDDMKAGGILLRFYYGNKMDRNVFPENYERAIFILKKNP